MNNKLTDEEYEMARDIQMRLFAIHADFVNLWRIVIETKDDLSNRTKEAKKFLDDFIFFYDDLRNLNIDVAQREWEEKYNKEKQKELEK